MKENKLKNKLVFFLHTCFTVAKDSGAGKSAYFYDYLRLLDFYAYSSIKTLAKKITSESAIEIHHLSSASFKITGSFTKFPLSSIIGQ